MRHAVSNREGLKRRQVLLAATGGLTTTGLTGCLWADSADSGDDTGDEQPGNGGNDTETTDGNRSVVFSWTPFEPGVGQEVVFDATGAETNTPVVEYRWDFTGDGEVDVTTDEPVAGYTFEKPGYRTVALEVETEDGDIAAGTTEVPVDVVEAAFVWLPTQPVAGEEIAFDATSSTGDIAEYRWDFTGDGSFDRAVATPVTSYTFEEPGQRAVTLNVEGTAGHTDTTTLELPVTDG